MSYDWKTVSDITGLTKEEIIAIAQNYEELERKYPEAKKKAEEKAERVAKAIARML